MEPSDREIIARVRAGDVKEFHELVRRHAAPVWSTLRSSLRHTEDARDVFQETWMRALERIDSLRRPERLRSWLLSIALNQVRQLHRQGRRHEDGERVGPHVQPETTEPAPEENLSRREESERLLGHIDELPTRQREVLDLRLNHELTHGEIASLLGITPENSRANYYQALKSLRRRYGLLNEEMDRP